MPHLVRQPPLRPYRQLQQPSAATTAHRLVGTAAAGKQLLMASASPGVHSAGSYVLYICMSVYVAGLRRFVTGTAVGMCTHTVVGRWLFTLRCHLVQWCGAPTQGGAVLP